MKKRFIIDATIAGLVLVLAHSAAPTFAQGQAPAAPAGATGGGRGTTPAPDPTRPHRLEIGEGTTARYRVQEQLAGINFPSEAVGTTGAITGGFVINPNGSFGPQSKMSVDLRSIKSDQAQRDGYVQGRVFEVEKFPTLDVVPKRAIGLAAPLPATGQTGFQLVSDVTLHGVTKEVTWNVVAVLNHETVAGRATSTIDFATFNMAKPVLARLLSVDDKIHLEIEFRTRRTVQ